MRPQDMSDLGLLAADKILLHASMSQNKTIARQACSQRALVQLEILTRGLRKDNDNE